MIALLSFSSLITKHTFMLLGWIAILHRGPSRLMVIPNLFFLAARTMAMLAFFLLCWTSVTCTKLGVISSGGSMVELLMGGDVLLAGFMVVLSLVLVSACFLLSLVS